MGTKLDPTDKSKVFGETLNALLENVIELEESDFRDCLVNDNYKGMLTTREIDKLQNWMDGIGKPGMPRETLLKCGHPYAKASVLWAMIADGE